MTALLKFLKVLILGALAIALAGAVIGVGYWQYARQAELLDGFEYMAWDSDYQTRIKEIDRINGKPILVFQIGRRYADHWIAASTYPDGFKRGGEDKTGTLSIAVFWDAECEEGTEIDTGKTFASGAPIILDCEDGDKLMLGLGWNGGEDKSPYDSLPEYELDLGGFKVDFSVMKYWPWDEAKKFATLQKATMSSDAD